MYIPKEDMWKIRNKEYVFPSSKSILFANIYLYRNKILEKFTSFFEINCISNGADVRFEWFGKNYFYRYWKNTNNMHFHYQLYSQKIEINIGKTSFIYFFETRIWKMVNKSEKQFFLKLHCPKSDLNFWQISALASKMGQLKEK